MKGLVLAGGLGTRLYPITRVLNKHVLLVFDKPMFYYPILTLVKSGIKEIGVVSGPPFGDQIYKLLKFLPLPKRVRIKYIEQPKPLGMPDAIMRCRKFVGKGDVVVFAGDNIYGEDFQKELSDFRDGALSFLRKVEDPTRFGVPVYNSKRELVSIHEKPKKTVSSWVVTGPHIFDARVFELISKLKFSNRGELELADLNSLYIKTGKLKLVKRSDFWLDLGTFESLFKANSFIRSNLKL